MVLLALLPAVWTGYCHFGSEAMYHLAYTVVTAVSVECVCQLVLKRPVTILDGSAALTGLLLGMCLPPAAPFWIGPAGAVVAIVLVKQMYGGLGCNFVNPALTARALLHISWPTQMSAFVKPYEAIAAVTPLGVIADYDSTQAVPSMMQLFNGEIAGCIGETSAMALMIGGIVLIFLEVIDYRIPTGIMAAVFITASLYAGPGSSIGFSFNNGLIHLLSGGTMLAAFFMATDYVTSPITPKARWLYGVSIGVLTVIIRLWGAYPEGLTFAILLMNIVAPLMERLTFPRRFGEVR